MGKDTKWPVRILQVVGGMDRGGAETWLMHVLRNIDRDRFQMEFLVHTTESSAFDDEIRALGSKVIPCLQPSNPVVYARNFKQIMRQYGPYDVVHSHVQHFSGYALYLAYRAKVPLRIVHSHLDTSGISQQAHGLRRLYFSTMQRWISNYATAGLAVSREAGSALFGARWFEDRRYEVLYCAIDLEPFSNQEVNARAVRAELGIPENAFVIGHVGRFHEQKNHKFLIEIASEIARREPEMRLLLVGDGPLRGQLDRQTVELGLEGHVFLLGQRDDVGTLLEASDIYVTSSHWEGLPVSVLEAMAAGLPVIATTVGELPYLVVRQAGSLVPPRQPERLAAEINNLLLNPERMESMGAAGREHIRKNFSPEVWVRQLLTLYAGVCPPARELLD